MSKRKTTKARKKNAKLTKGQELNNLEYKKGRKNTSSKRKKTNTSNKTKAPTPKVIKSTEQIKEQITSVESKPKVQPKATKNTKKKIRFEAEKKHFFNKTTIILMIILGILCGYAAVKFSYVYDFQN